MRPHLWRNRLLLSAGLWLLACVLGWVLGMGPRPGLVALVIAAVGSTVWLFLDASAEQQPTSWRLTTDDPVRPPGQDPRLAFLVRLVAGHLDSREPSEHLHRHLAAVTDQRLMAHHGTTREADPEAASALMGPELTTFLTRPRQRLTTRQIDHLITRIELL